MGAVVALLLLWAIFGGKGNADTSQFASTGKYFGEFPAPAVEQPHKEAPAAAPEAPAAAPAVEKVAAAKAPADKLVADNAPVGKAENSKAAEQPFLNDAAGNSGSDS